MQIYIKTKLNFYPRLGADMFCLHNKVIVLAALLLILSGSATTYAKEQQIIDIKAEYLILDEKKGISKYKGNVLFTKGLLIIKADTVTLYSKNEELIKAIVKGSPADVQHQPDNEEKVHSQAKHMEFFVKEDRLVLKKNAFVDQGNRHFSGEYIEYDTRQRIITAAGNQNKSFNAENTKSAPPKQRVHVIIGPEDDADEVDDKAENSDDNKE